MEKICSKCKIKKTLDDFSIDKNTKSGVRSQCKECISKRYILNKEKVLLKQKQNYDPLKKKEYYLKNINDCTKRNKEYYKEKKDEILLRKKINYNKDAKKEYYLKHKNRINKSASKRISIKRHSNSIFKLKHNISCLIRNSIKKNGYKKSKKTEEIIGCTIADLIIHLSNMFLDGMSFDNHGEWHIDHIVPLVTAKTEEEVIKLNHYTNLQPLWAKDNLSKGGKYNQTFKSE